MRNLSHQSPISVTTPDRATELAQWLRQYALGETTFADERLLNEAADLLTKSAQVEAAAGADTKRIEWLEDHCSYSCGGNGGNYLFSTPADAETVRDAIDAAMSAQPTPGKAGA